MDPEGGTGGLDPSGKSQVAIDFLRNTGTDAISCKQGMDDGGDMDGYRGGTGGLDPSGKSQVAIGFLRNTGTDAISCKQGMGDGGNMDGYRGGGQGVWTPLANHKWL